MAGVRAVRDDGRRKVITLDDPAAGQAIFTAATANGYIQEFSQQAPTLDEIFRIKAGAQND